MPGYHLFNELTRDQLNAIREEALVVLPVAATEQHGPHLPVGTDTFAVERVSRGAAKIAGEEITVVVAPTLPFGSSEHHLQFGGSFSLSIETWYRVLTELVESLVTCGFKTIFIVNGHGGNSELIQLVARDVALKKPVSIAAAPYWNIGWDALVEAGIHQGGRLPGHAGRFETSLVLADRPQLVVEPLPHRDLPEGFGEPRMVAPVRDEIHGWWARTDGYTDSPALGTAELGNLAFEAIIGAVAQAFVSFHRKAEAARS